MLPNESVPCLIPLKTMPFVHSCFVLPYINFSSLPKRLILVICVQKLIKREEKTEMVFECLDNFAEALEGKRRRDAFVQTERIDEGRGPAGDNDGKATSITW